MFDRVVPSRGVPHRTAVGVACGVVAVAAVLAGVARLAWERDPEWFSWRWDNSWVGSVNLTIVATIFVVSFTVAGRLFFSMFSGMQSAR